MSLKVSLLAGLALLSTAAMGSSVHAANTDLLGSSCKTVTEQVGPCAVEFKVCGGFYKRHFRYTATACASDKCGSSGHTKSAKGAAEEAAQALFAQAPSCAVPGQLASPKFETSFSVEEVDDTVVDLAAEEEEEVKLTGITCKKATEQVGPCKVEFKVCGRISKFKWVYDATACASGKCASAGGYKSGEGAAEEAAKKLFAMAPACAIPSLGESVTEEKTDDLSAQKDGETKLTSLTCKKATQQVGPCKVEFKVCGRISRFKWVYDATACASGKCASAGGHESGKGAAEEAAKKLFAMAPACAIPAAGTP